MDSPAGPLGLLRLDIINQSMMRRYSANTRVQRPSTISRNNLVPPTVGAWHLLRLEPGHYPFHNVADEPTPQDLRDLYINPQLYRELLAPSIARTNLIEIFRMYRVLTSEKPILTRHCTERIKTIHFQLTRIRKVECAKFKQSR